MRIVVASVFTLLVCAASAMAQQALPPTLASAGITQAEWNHIREDAARHARRANIAEAALLAAAERAGANLALSRRYSAIELRDAIVGQLGQQAQTIRELQTRLQVLARADDPEIARLLTDARLAIDEGRLGDADQFLALAEESDLAAVAVAEARAERARARIADAIAERGRLDRIQGGGAAADVRAAVVTYQAALGGMSRAMAPRDWAQTQFNLGIAYAILAQGGDSESRVLAIGALRAAQSGFGDLGDTEGVSRTQRLIAALEVR